MLTSGSTTGGTLFGDRVPSSANAGSVKPSATMMPRQNRFIGSSTQVQSRACGTHNQSQILQGIAPPWAFPAAFPTQGIGTPGRQLANQKNTTGSKARLSAIWPRKREKVLYGATGLVYHYQKFGPENRGGDQWPMQFRLKPYRT